MKTGKTKDDYNIGDKVIVIDKTGRNRSDIKFNCGEVVGFGKSQIKIFEYQDRWRNPAVARPVTKEAKERRSTYRDPDNGIFKSIDEMVKHMIPEEYINFYQ